MSRRIKKAGVITVNAVVILSILGMFAIMLLSNHSLENMIREKRADSTGAVTQSY